MPPSTPPLSIPPVVPEKEPAEKEPVQQPPALPVDIPQFAQVNDKVASGHKPLPEGLTWLRDRGFKSALHLKAPGEDDAAARRQFEAKGLRYVSLEVSPEAIKQGVGTDFSAILKDAARQPLFVYDRDGSLAGPLWFLHFRLTEGLNREKALEELSRLGFKPDEDGPQRELWLAVQQQLSMPKAMSDPNR
jgi:protein tyrosine phosphatase (PTP) superfamily phosphohydrolase (DUF442 family)